MHLPDGEKETPDILEAAIMTGLSRRAPRDNCGTNTMGVTNSLFIDYSLFHKMNPTRGVIIGLETYGQLCHRP